jgi:chromosome segregation ATPase
MATPVDDGEKLLRPLQKTQSVAADLESASNHALVIGTVLAHELPDEVQVGEVAQAIEQTEELKDKLAESAETLTEVSAELEQEITKRRAVAKKLEESRAQVEKLAAKVSDLKQSAP